MKACDLSEGKGRYRVSFQLAVIFMVLLLVGFKAAVSRAGSGLMELKQLSHLKHEPFKEKLKKLPERMRPSEKELYCRKEVVNKKKWKNYHDDMGKQLIFVLVMRPAFSLATLGIINILGDLAFWQDIGTKTGDPVVWQTPVSPFIYSLFDDMNPLDAVLVPPAWLIGVTRIKTQKEITEKKVKADNYKALIAQMKSYDKELAEKNKKIEAYNHQIETAIERLNNKIERHNKRMHQRYEKLLKNDPDRASQALEKYNGAVDQCNAKIERGLFPEPLPILSP